MEMPEHRSIRNIRVITHDKDNDNIAFVGYEYKTKKSMFSRDEVWKEAFGFRTPKRMSDSEVTNFNTECEDKSGRRMFINGKAFGVDLVCFVDEKFLYWADCDITYLETSDAG